MRRPIGTEYGTGPLQDDGADAAENTPLMPASSSARPIFWRWGVAALGVVATVALLTANNGNATNVRVDMATLNAAKEPAEPAEPAKAKPATAAESAPIECWQSLTKDGKVTLMEQVTGLQWKPAAKAASAVTVDATKRFQEIIGWGGAFTEAAGLQFAKLSAEKQQKVLELYFDKETGANYQLGRVPMGSCDFSVKSYNYDNVTNDTQLVHFDEDLTRDSEVIIPLLKAAIAKNPKLKLILAPWSPPAWMKNIPEGKQSAAMTGSARPVGLNAKFRQSWALYFSKFITAYKKKDINFWALTPQNEPEFAAPWEGCVYTAQYEADFVAEFLGPVIKKDHPELKLLAFDHNRDHVADWAKTFMNHPKAKTFIDGIAFHWYDMQRYMDGVEYFEHLNDTHAILDPSHIILASEACNCPGIAEGKEAWFRAQRYAHDIITDMNNWVAGWIDWNLILDHKGGPNHLGNVCDAPLVLTKDEKDFFIQPMYYFIQHFSKFVAPGSHRINTDVAVKFAKPGDAQLYPRYPSAIYSCDGSSRQLIHVTDDKKLQITGTKWCIDIVHQDKNDPQVELVNCIYTPQTYQFVNDQIRMDGKCLQLNHGSTDSGARVVIGECVENAPWQKWAFKDGVMHSLASDKCVTAGYSFVQAASFVTPEEKKVTVVLNENTEDAKFELQFEKLSFETVVPAGGIRTFTWA